MNMTPSQERAIQEIIENSIRYQFSGDDLETRRRAPLAVLAHSDYEFKQFNIAFYPRYISVVVEIGLRGDEGTAAALFGRDYRHYHIGRRGGIELLNPKRKKDGRGKSAFFCITL